VLWRRAANSAGQTNENGVNIMQDPVIPPGACPDGCGSNKPYEPEISAGLIKLNEEESARAVREYEAKHAKELEARHAREHEEREFMQAAARAAFAHRHRFSLDPTMIFLTVEI
jgi:hypothetical protein